MPNVPKQIILGAALGYSAARLRLFVTSARLHHPDADIVLVIGRLDRGLLTLAKRHRVEYLHWNADRDYARYHPTLARYFIYREYLRRHKVQGAFITDTRDVCFQANLFARLLDTSGERLCLFEEDAGVAIGEEPINAAWLKIVLTDVERRVLAPLPIICSGTTAGTRRAILEYLERMCNEITKRSALIGRRPYLDQAIHNHVARSGGLTAERVVYPNSASPVFTMHLCRNVVIANGLVLSPDTLAPVAVVHQFDRFPAVHKALARAISLGDARRIGRLQDLWRTIQAVLGRATARIATVR